MEMEILQSDLPQNDDLQQTYTTITTQGTTVRANTREYE